MIPVRKGMARMLASYYESDPHTLAVLSTALRSRSRATRLRAVAMLSRVDCQQRDGWLDAALRDPDRAVRETTDLVLTWLIPASECSLPRGEAPTPEPDDVGLDSGEEWALLDTRGYEWEYIVEVWRSDGLQLGVYAMSTCQEDDRHARSIALGQAILANVGTRGDTFDPERAATFIVEKRRRPPGITTR